jgi:hypothetical protein
MPKVQNALQARVIAVVNRAWVPHFTYFLDLSHFSSGLPSSSLFFNPSSPVRNLTPEETLSE